MSGPISPGKYNILSLLNLLVLHPPTGITDNDSAKQASIQLNQPESIWVVTGPQPSGNGYTFRIGSFNYTGVSTDGTNTVIATDEQDQNVTWYINYIEDQQGYIISQNTQPSESRILNVWTVIAEDPSSTIAVKPIVYLVDLQVIPSQLFSFYQPSTGE